MLSRQTIDFGAQVLDYLDHKTYDQTQGQAFNSLAWFSPVNWFEEGLSAHKS